MKKFILFILFIGQGIIAQSIKGTLPQLKNTEIVLMGREGFSEKELTKTTCDSLGNFQIHYPKNYVGAAVLQPKEESSVIVLLNQENFSMQWSDLKDFKTLNFINSPENEAFGKAINIIQEAELKLNGLKYLLPQYIKQPKQHQWLMQEIAIQENGFPNFVKSLPKNRYTAYYIQIRKLINDMPQTANRYIERMPQHETDFKNLNFNDDRLWQSGLMSDLFSGFYQLMESHGEIEKVTAHANMGTDAWIKNLANNPTRQQIVAEYCFKWLEKRSLFGAAEHLALAMLNNQSCQLTPERTALFEQYRKMAVGQIAPDIQFENSNFSKTKLSEINTKYRLVVFGSSWCEKCKEEIPKLKKFYQDWKTKYNLEIILNSLDTNKEQYDNFIKDFLWISNCDYKSWEGKAARDYFVFGTPTMYLLDKNNKILLKPISAEQIETWLTTFDKE